MAPPTTNQEYLGTTFIISAFLSAILVGFSTIQGYLYFRNFQKDPHWLKCLIAAVWILDSLHISLILGSVHNTFITHFNDPTIFQHSFPNSSLAFDVAFVMGTMSMALVLAFHSYRVKLVTPNRVLQWMCFVVTGTRNVLLLLLAVLSCVAIGTTWVSSGSAPTNDEGSEFLSGWTGSLLLATVALSTLSDVNGTIIVSASLWKHRREKLSSTRHLVTKIILYTVQTGACRAIFMFSLLILIIFAPINISWIVLVVVGPRVYTNSLLTTLNTRVNLTSANLNVLDENGVSFYYVGPDLESIQFEGSTTVTTKPSYDHEVQLHEVEVSKREREEDECAKTGMKRQPRLDMTTISLSGSTPPVSPVVDLREGQTNEIPALPGDEAPLAAEDELDHHDPLRDGHPDLENERVVFQGRGRFFTLNATTSSPSYSLPPSALNPSRFSDTLSQKGPVPQEWEEAGDGEAYLLRDRESGRMRFVFVTGKSESVVASHEVTRTLDLHHTPFSERSWTWRTSRWKDDRVAVRFDDVEAAYIFRSVFFGAER